MPRFHSPLIEPGGRFSRTGLSDKNSRVRPREAVRPGAQADQSQYVVQVPVGESCQSPVPHLVLGAPPPAEPLATVPVDGTVRRAHGTKAEVVRPSQKLPVQSSHPFLGLRPEPPTVGHLADL